MRTRLILISVLFFFLISLPFVYAFLAAGDEYVFGGFLINPIDGNTYLAKMYQGWRGEWRFKLPYTAQPGNGAYLNLFYIFLGHLARISGFSLVAVFHFARLAAVLLLLTVIWLFLSSCGLEDRWMIPVFALMIFGSGMGWLVFPSGVLTSDFSVPEMYPFLSSFVNPHFTFGLALQLYLLICVFKNNNITQKKFLSDWQAGLGALLLSIVDPFGVVIVLIVLAGLLLCSLLQRFFDKAKQIKQNNSLREINGFVFPVRVLVIRLAWITVFGLPVIIYDLLISNWDPVLAGWNAQNLTPSAPIWDLLLSLSPAFILALLGISWVIKNRQWKACLFLVWIAAALVLLYLPFSLQRRFMKGLYIPVVVLAAYGFIKLSQNGFRRVNLVLLVTIVLSLFTNLLFLILAFYGIQMRSPLLFMTRGEVNAFNWVELQTEPDALILASAQTGLYIPAHTGRRVIYGHPFETVNALQEEATVDNFFLGEGVLEPARLLTERQVDYVFYGPREKELGALPQLQQLQIVFNQEDVIIFQVIQNNPE